MPYRIPYPRLDDDETSEIAAFHAIFRRERRWTRLLVLVVAVDVASVGFAAIAASQPPVVPPPPRRADCVYDGCFCRGEAHVEPIACKPNDARPCLLVADECPP
jgi:hypothetical protein